jgi:hypothetical protein
LKTWGKEITLINVFDAVLVIFVLYNIGKNYLFINIAFIPLQAGYRIEYAPIFIVLEVFTVILYSIDIFWQFKRHKVIADRLNDRKVKEASAEMHLWRSVEDEKKNLKYIKIYIVL